MNPQASSPLSATDQIMFDMLLNTYLDTTQPLLQKDKFLIPIGMRLRKDGKSEFVSLDTDGEPDDMAEHLQNFRQLLNTTSQDDVACLLAYDVRLRDNPEFDDALTVELEAKTGTRIKLLIPYRFIGFRKELQLGELGRIDPDTESIY